MNAARESAELRGLWLSLGIYAFVFVLKLAAYFATGVLALLAEALHTLADIFISAFLLAAAVWSRKAADEGHMFGHGRAQNVAALVAATLFISFTSLRLYEEAIGRLLSPEEAAHQNLELALGVIVISMLVAAAPLVQLMRQQRRGAAAKAQLLELVNDELGLLAALVGTLFVAAGQPLADPLATAAVATVIGVNAVGLFRENASFLLGRSPGQAYVERIKAIALSVEGVQEVGEVRAEYVGPETIHAGIHIRVPWRLSVAEADRIAEEVHERLHKATDCRYCTIHVDPAEPENAPAAAGSPTGTPTTRLPGRP